MRMELMHKAFLSIWFQGVTRDSVSPVLPALILTWLSFISSLDPRSDGRFSLSFKHWFLGVTPSRVWVYVVFNANQLRRQHKICDLVHILRESPYFRASCHVHNPALWLSCVDSSYPEFGAFGDDPGLDPSRARASLFVDAQVSGLYFRLRVSGSW